MKDRSYRPNIPDFKNLRTLLHTDFLMKYESNILLVPKGKSVFTPLYSLKGVWMGRRLGQFAPSILDLNMTNIKPITTRTRAAIS